ncbi:hypothetical protein [Actinoplanes sp. GCM10030250]|uniref:hypothetical protein n=1 Tax=Actinoplanes sp. GCM10030250 TaxID=3273376 RepID=UPI0036107CCA
MTDQSDEASSVQRRADVKFRFLPLVGSGDTSPVPLTGNAPAVPPGTPGVRGAELPVAGRPVTAPPGGSRLLGSPSSSEAPASVSFLNEPTERLPIVTPEVSSLRSRRPPPRVAGRVVLIYEQQIRKPRRLWVFTAALVSLTVGVVLGQTEAYQPATSRPASASQVGDVPVPDPSAVIQAPPPVPLTAPLGAVKQRRLEIAGAATTLRVRTAELGESLFTITALDQGTVPQLTDTANGSLLALTAGAAGPVGAEVVLNSRVDWTLGLTGGATELDVDSRAGGLVGVELAAGVSRGVLQLAKPKGTVPLAVTGSVVDLTVRTEAGAPVRVRLGKGAGLATINGKARRGVKAGVTLRETGWPTAKDRYDVRVTADVSTLLVERSTPAR